MEEFSSICDDYIYVPTIMPPVKRIVVIGDIHGDYKMALHILIQCGVINKKKQWIGDNCYVVQVGDQIDRCRPNEYKCDDERSTIDDENSDIKILELFNNLQQQAIKFGGNVISLLGNHEILNVLGHMENVSKKGIDEFTYKDLKGLTARETAFKPSNKYAKLLGCSRLACVIIGSNLFVHGGIVKDFLNQMDIKSKEDLENINIMVRKWLLGLIKQDDKLLLNKNSIFWNRIMGTLKPNLSEDDEACKNILDILEILKIDNIIVGHTPQIFINKKGINKTCDHIWRVDTGTSTTFDSFDVDKKLNRKNQYLEILNDNIFNVHVI